MFGIDAIMDDALGPYKILIERLQIQYQPIAHRVRRWYRDLFHDLNYMFLQNNSTFGPSFQQWVMRDSVNEELADQVKAMGRHFVYNFLKNLRHRLTPYWKIFLAVETINPCGPHRTSPVAWEGVRDLCVRVGMTESKAEACVANLQKQKDDAGEWNLAETKACTSNLLRFYHDRLMSERDEGANPAYPLANDFATLVFSLHVASAIIETYFSRTKYAKNIYRSKLSDDLASATLHLQDLRDLHDIQILESSGDRTIDFRAAMTFIENGIKELRKKYLGSKVTKIFFDEDQQKLRNYSGEVTDVHFSREDGCYLFRTEYDNDNDVEEMELWELQKFI